MKNRQLAAALIISATLITGCASSGPRLYSPVLPMEDGSLLTSPTADKREKSIVRATRNAERYCEHRNKSYVALKISTTYEGILGNATVAKVLSAAETITLGILPTGRGTDYRTELAFKCI